MGHITNQSKQVTPQTLRAEVKRAPYSHHTSLQNQMRTLRFASDGRKLPSFFPLKFWSQVANREALLRELFASLALISPLAPTILSENGKGILFLPRSYHHPHFSSSRKKGASKNLDVVEGRHFFFFLTEQEVWAEAGSAAGGPG